MEPLLGAVDTTRILVVDETRDGNGRPGSPNDIQSDSLWRVVLGYDTISWRTPQGWLVSELDYVSHRIEGVNYVSPLDLYNKNLVIWHADDKATFDLYEGTFNRRVLSEYLDRGGRLFICGWDIGRDIGGDYDTLTFSSSSFGGKYLRLLGGKRNPTDRIFNAAAGQIGYGDVHIDPAKLPAAWNGTLDRCWVFYPAHRSESIELWLGAPFDGLPVAVKNFSPLNPWRTITCGFPVYFLDGGEAQSFVRKAAEELLAN